MMMLALALMGEGEHARALFMTQGPPSSNKAHEPHWGRRGFVASLSALSPFLMPAAAPAAGFNPLTSKGLEALRILNQVEADNMKYDGELAAVDGSSVNPKIPALLLVPIAKIENKLKIVRFLPLHFVRVYLGDQNMRACFLFSYLLDHV